MTFKEYRATLSLWDTKLTMEEQELLLERAYNTGSKEVEERRCQDTEFSEWKDAEVNEHIKITTEPRLDPIDQASAALALTRSQILSHQREIELLRDEVQRLMQEGG